MFEVFDKIPRLSRGCVVTEKIDGTNAQIHIVGMAERNPEMESLVISEDADRNAILAGSRSRYVTPKQDNYGFASWVRFHAQELLTLGPGRHYGEWWGSGIQRGYGLTGGEKRLSLFNVSRWTPGHTNGTGPALPECVRLVPVLYAGLFTDDAIERVLVNLAANGSQAAPGFMKPEGIIVYHVAARSMFKKTIEKDESPKSQEETECQQSQK